MNLYDECGEKEVVVEEAIRSKLAFAVECINNDHNEFYDFIGALCFCHEHNKGVMTPVNFCRFLTEFEKAMTKYRDMECIDFTEFRSVVIASLQKYCLPEKMSHLIKMAIYASERPSMEELYKFCRIQPQQNDYDSPF